MKLVNITQRNVYTSAAGSVAPGRKTPDLYHDLEKELEKVVKMCGKNFGIILNDKELALIESIVKLDETGDKFDPLSIPDEIRLDPLGKKRASEMARKVQQADLDATKKANAEKARREAIINGEIDERKTLARKPVGPATIEGQKVEPSMLKSGFESILEENARIASGKQKPPANPQEMLDPVGAHMKKEGAEVPAPANNDGTVIGDAKPIEQARNRDDDGTRSADTAAPLPSVSERAGAMDRQAAETARLLSTIGPATPAHTAAPADADPIDPSEPTVDTNEGQEGQEGHEAPDEDASPKKGKKVRGNGRGRGKGKKEA